MPSTKPIKTDFQNGLLRLSRYGSLVGGASKRGEFGQHAALIARLTDFDAMGVEGVFDNVGVSELISILEEVRQRAAA